MKRTLLSFLTTLAFISAFAQIPTGYYDGTSGLNGATLKSKLKQIITAGHIDNGYGGLWTGYQTTDRDNIAGIAGYENDGTIMDMYSENPNSTDPYNFTYGSTQCGGSGYTNEGDCYNREHVVPQSLFNEDFPMKSDIHFIRATDGKVNGMRSNYPFGTVGATSYTSLNGSKLGTSASPGYSGTVFEPINAFKGDIARMIFYFVTRYETQLSGFSSGNMLGGSAFPGLQTWELNQLLAWNAADPVSQTEIARNNASYVYQGNRNPFIDHPEYVAQIWGNIVADTEAPTIPTNLAASSPTSNSISLSWTASTDNTGVAGYEIYVNGVLYSTVSATTATVSGLNPSTTYTFYIIAKDASGNASAASNTATGTTLAGGQSGGGNTSCGTENFENIPASTSGYATRTWTNNNITWTATDARTDQDINGSGNRAITIRNGNLTSSTISGGIQSLTARAQLEFTGASGSLDVKVNGIIVGTIPYTSTSNALVTINNINVSGNFIISIVNPINGNRISIDDLSWTCSATLGTTEAAKEKSGFIIYPNPVKNNELYVKGDNLSRISKAQIYDLSGKLIQTIENPFRNANKIHLKGLTKGNYILTAESFSAKFIIE